jgi:addiction module RelB/DinJ family antitoxin
MVTNTKTLITVKTDKTLKRAVQEVSDEIGISIGTLINSFLRQFVRTKEVYFSVSEKPNMYLRAVIDEAMREYKEGKLPPPVNSVEELVKELRS